MTKLSEFTLKLVRGKSKCTHDANTIKSTVKMCNEKDLPKEFAKLLDTCLGDIDKLIDNGLSFIYIDNRNYEYGYCTTSEVLEEKNKYKFMVIELINNHVLAIFDTKKAANEYIGKQDKFEYDINGNINLALDYHVALIQYYRSK